MQIIDFDGFKKGKYRRVEPMTLEDCIRELDRMSVDATPRQKNAINLSINLIVEYMRGVDDGK